MIKPNHKRHKIKKSRWTEIDADKVEDLENMPVMQEKAERTVVSIHDHPSHSDEDEDHQVCEVELGSVRD